MNIVIAGINGYLGFKTKTFFINKGYNVFDYKKKTPNKIDVIINMSGPPQDFCKKYPQKTRFLRSKLNKKLINLAIKKKANFFFYISTMHVYQDAKFLRTNSKVFPKNPYSVSHINGENIIVNANNRNKKINFKILRLTNCIGKPHKKKCNSWKLLVNDLCKQAVKNNFIKLNSMINVQRDFITIDFFLNSIFYIIKNNIKNLKINISSQKSLSILQLSKKIQKRFYKIFCKKIKIYHSIKKISDKRTVIKSLKFKYKNNLTKEIDETLIFAKKMFT